MKKNARNFINSYIVKNFYDEIFESELYYNESNVGNDKENSILSEKEMNKEYLKMKQKCNKFH